MQIHELNTKALTDPAWVPFDDGTDTYKADFNQIIDDAVAAAFTSADVSGGVVEYESEDAEPLSGAEWLPFDLLEGGENLETLFTLVSEMAYNVRWLRSHISVKGYSVTPAANTSVSPFSAYAEKDISSDVSAYGVPISLFVYGGGSTNPTVAKFNANKTSFWVYAKTAGTVTNVQVIYMKS